MFKQLIVAGPKAALSLHYHARDVYLVLGGRGSVTVSFKGQPARTVPVGAYKLYTLRSSGTIADGLLRLTFSPGVQAYAFTFG